MKMEPRTVLQAEGEAKSVFDIFQHVAAKPANWLVEHVPVDRDDLRDVRHRILGQPGHPGRNEDIAGCIEEAQVRGQHDGDYGSQTTPVEGVILHDEEWTAEPRLRAAWLPQVCPPHLTALDYHSRSSARR